MNRPVEAPLLLARIDLEPGRLTRHPRHLHAPLDLLYIQAGLRRETGIEAPLVDHWLLGGPLERLFETIMSHRPRGVLLRANGWARDETVRLGRALRARGVVTVVAGQLVSHAARLPVAGWDEAFDLALLGEPEAAAVPLLQALLAGGDPASLAAPENERFRARQPHQVERPDALAPPRQPRDGMARYRFPFPLAGRPAVHWGYVQSSWGCPSRCRHCTEVVRKSVGFRYRTRSVDAVADEVARLRDAGADAIGFEDDSLLADRRHFLALCDALARLRPRVRWLASVRPDDLDEQSVAAAAAAGAALLKVGVETGSPRLVEQIGKARDGGDWLARTRHAFALLQHHHIGSVALFLTGLPGEQDADRAASLALARQLSPDYLQVQRFTPYPDVKLGVSAATTATAAAPYHYRTAASGDPEPPQGASADDALYRGYYLQPGFVARHLARCWRSYLTPALAAERLAASVAAARYVLGR